jgi:hypothetical protein
VAGFKSADAAKAAMPRMRSLKEMYILTGNNSQCSIKTLREEGRKGLFDEMRLHLICTKYKEEVTPLCPVAALTLELWCLCSLN